MSLTPQINLNPISPAYRSAREIGVLPGCSPQSRRTSSCDDYVLSPPSSSVAVCVWSSGSFPTSKPHSPISPTYERKHLPGSLYSHVIGRREESSYTPSESFPTQHGTPPYSQEPHRRFRAYSLASPIGTSNAYPGSVRRTSSDIHQGVYGAAEAGSFVQRPSLPPFRGQLGYPAPRRNSYEVHIQPNAFSDDRAQVTRSTDFTQSLRVGTSSPTHGQPQRQDRSPLQCQEPSHEIRSAPPIATPQVPWSLSRTQHSSSIAFPSPYTSQAPYNTFGSSTEEAIKPEESTGFSNVPMMGLGLPQQFFSQRPG